MAKTVEIDEEEYARLHKLGQTLGAIMANPKAAALAEQERRARRYLARTREHQQAQGAWRARVAARRPRVAARPLETA